jgi:hypothetical protein
MKTISLRLTLALCSLVTVFPGNTGAAPPGLLQAQEDQSFPAAASAGTGLSVVARPAPLLQRHLDGMLRLWCAQRGGWHGGLK